MGSPFLGRHQQVKLPDQSQFPSCFTSLSSSCACTMTTIRSPDHSAGKTGTTEAIESEDDEEEDDEEVGREEGTRAAHVALALQ
jgi:hypothetical protein